MFIGTFKIKSDSFNLHYQNIGKTPTTRLMGLASFLEQWNKNRISKNTKGAIEGLSIEDVQALRKLISIEVSSIKTNNQDVAIDQILFLIVGAIKIQSQDNSAFPLPLINQSIKAFVTPVERHSKNMMFLSLMSFVIVIGFVMTLLAMNTKNVSTVGLNSIEASPVMPVSKVRSKVVENLVNIYQEMQVGDCQLPQATMLQPKDREAFITFVTEGKVTMNTAESLQKSLDYANCKYPQKLMNNPLNIFKDNG